MSGKNAKNAGLTAWAFHPEANVELNQAGLAVEVKAKGLFSSPEQELTKSKAWRQFTYNRYVVMPSKSPPSWVVTSSSCSQ